MSIFSNILGKIFGTKHDEAAPASSQSAPSTSTPSASSTDSPSKVSASKVDVGAVLNQLAQKNPQKLNWRTSIVDLLKLLEIDSSLKARQDLAKELSYSGNVSDSASMNTWLQKQVMQKLADNGGVVPAELRS